MLANLINNIAFLIALVAAGQLVMLRSYQHEANRQIALGLLFGATALLGMLNPVPFQPGVIFDGRSIVLAVAGVVGGPLTAAIGAGIAAAYRYYLGGSGAAVGISVVVLSAALGVLAATWWRKRAITPQWSDFLALGIVVQIAQLIAFTQIPDRAGYAFIEQAWWILILFYPLATMLLCQMFANIDQQRQTRLDLQAAREARMAEEQASLQRFHAYFDHSIVGLAITSLDKGWLEVNDALCETLGYPRDELTRMTWAELTHPDDLAADVAQFNRMLSGEIDSYAMDKRFMHKRGHVVYTRLAVSHVRKPDGSVDYVIAMVEDVSDRHHAVQALELERAHLRGLFGAIPNLIWLKDTEGRYISCNEAFEQFFGAKERDIVGKTDYDFVPAPVADEFRRHDRAAMEAGAPTRNEEWVTYASDGRHVLLETTKVPMRTPDGRLIGVVGVGYDITERHAHQQHIERLAHFDTLTGLPNRTLLADRLRQALAQAQRHQTTVAVAYLDLDGFKEVNDRCGHAVGDRLLQALSERMRHALREVDTLGRMGGDEFVAILIDLPSVDASVPLLSRLVKTAAEAVQIDGETVQVSASLGVTYYPQADPVDADQLLRQADQAMYQAKQMGKNRYHLFDADHDRRIRGEHEELARIKQGLANGEFVLYYQPKVNLRTGAVIGAEALIRWQHPERGLLSPAAFLPLVNETPFAVELGNWVLATAMAQVEAWKAIGLPLSVSVNIDAIHLAQSDFVDRLRALMAAHPAVKPGDLELEVLETNALYDIAQVSEVIRACRAIGVQFALDDFGTGYSSLTYLKQLPVDLLKIDQTFVRDVLDQADALSILVGIQDLAKAFDRQVIAEGVETDEHAALLLRLGCDLAQGYAVARPMPANEIAPWVKAWRPEMSWRGLSSIDREDLPVLFAWVEHRAWPVLIDRYLRGESSTCPDLAAEGSRFSQWLATADVGSDERRRLVQDLSALHEDTLRLGRHLIELRQQSRIEEALERQPELLSLEQRFLTRLMDALPRRS